MAKKLTITLTPQEEANINGWVNFYLANPHLIGKKSTPGLSPVDGQTRIVLEDQTRARFDEIAAQFPAVAPAPTPTPVPTPAPNPNDGFNPPAGTFTMPGSYDSEMTREMPQDRERQVQPTEVFVMPCRLPAAFGSKLTFDMAIAEFRSPPAFMQASLSRTPGDFTNVFARGEGTSVICIINDVTAVGLKPNDVVYFNVRMWSRDLQHVTVTTPQGVRIGGHWPS